MFSASVALATTKGPSMTDSSGTPKVERNEAEVNVITGWP
ncbi:Uncharacterised protein [Mycobacterium tuberculosis]|nr:Uncharacterised protein [Mycobacterium tuberculosis]